MLAISFIWQSKKRGPKASLWGDPKSQAVGDNAHGADAAEPKGDEPQQPLRQRSRIWLRRRQ
jgi:hypothetical protein